MDIQFPLTTTTQRIAEFHSSSCPGDIAAAGFALENIGEGKPSDTPLPFSDIAKTAGLNIALYCGQAEPQYSTLWQRYTLWCARLVQHLLTDPCSTAILEVAERYAAGQATSLWPGSPVL